MVFDYKGITTQNKNMIFFAGPCVIESRDIAFLIARKLKSISDELNIQLVFKGSYDKANRTSLDSFRGIGMKESLQILKDIGEETGLLVLTDVHTPNEVEMVSQYVDILQVPAFLCRQTDMLTTVQDSNLAMLVKKGQFISGYDTEFIANKCSKAIEEKRFLLCERGTMFGYGNLVVDMRNLEIMKRFAPVIYDATHSLQMPSVAGGVSGGSREFIPSLLRATTALGVDGIFMEVHPNPKESKSDSATIFPLDKVESMLENVLALHKVASSLEDISIEN